MALTRVPMASRAELKGGLASSWSSAKHFLCKLSQLRCQRLSSLELLQNSAPRSCRRPRCTYAGRLWKIIRLKSDSAEPRFRTLSPKRLTRHSNAEVWAPAVSSLCNTSRRRTDSCKARSEADSTSSGQHAFASLSAVMMFCMELSSVL